MTRIEILNHYTVDRRLTINSPGKFEGEMIYAPHFYDMVMDGFGEPVYEDPPEDLSDEELDSWEMDGGDLLYTELDVGDEDRAMFPELDPDTTRVLVYESNRGLSTSRRFDMSHKLTFPNGKTYISHDCLCCGDYGGAGSVGVANIRCVLEQFEGRVEEWGYSELDAESEGAPTINTWVRGEGFTSEHRHPEQPCLHVTGGHGSETIYLLDGEEETDEISGRSKTTPASTMRRCPRSSWSGRTRRGRAGFAMT